MKYLKLFENFENDELDYDEIQYELKDRGYGDLSPNTFQEFEETEHYSGIKDTMAYIDEIDDYLYKMSVGEIGGHYYDEDVDDDDSELDSIDESKKSGVTASLKKKAKASGIPMGILRKVFAKGMQAWNAGHRPGVAQHQWGMGRVNSFITGAGGARKADADLWTKAKAAKARKKKK